MKRRKWFVAGILSVFLLGMSGTYAWHQSKVSVQNHIRTGDVNIGIQEYEKKEGTEVFYDDSGDRTVLPAQNVSKIPRITNYAQPCYVRVKIRYFSEIAENEEQHFFGMSEKWVKAADYYYWPEPLETGESVEVFKGITIPGQWTEETSDQPLEVTITAEAVQSDNFFPDFKSEQPWGDQEIELCVHEQNGAVTEVKKTYQQMSVSYEGAARNLVAVPDDFFGNFGVAMPGDVLSDTVAIRNTTVTEAEFFFHTAIPEELTGNERDLMEQIELQITREGRLLYSGSLGAETLKESPVSLGVYQPGAEGSIHFTLKLPAGLKNIYAQRETFVNWIFSVRGKEEILPEQEPGPAITQLSAPKTGLTEPYVAVPLLLAGAAAVSTWLLEKKERRISS